MLKKRNSNLDYISARGDQRRRRSRARRASGLMVSLLLHLLVAVGIFLTPRAAPLFEDVPVTLVELVPSPEPDAGLAKEKGGGGGGQEAGAQEAEAKTAPNSSPEPAETVAEQEVPEVTPDPEVSVTEPEPKVETPAPPAPAPPTPVRPRVAVLPAPPEISVAMAAAQAEPIIKPGFLDAAGMAGAITAGGGAGAASGSGAGTGTGSGSGSGSGTGTGAGAGSGRGTGDSDAHGPGAACDMAARLQEAVRNTPQVRAAVAEMARNADAVGQALIIWDGEWVLTGGQDGKGLAGVRQAVSVTVAFAPQACKAEAVSGFVVLKLGEGENAPRVALGRSQWRWNDLLEVERSLR